MPSPENFLPRKYLPKVPDDTRVITGKQLQIEGKAQELFDRTLDYLGIPRQVRGDLCSVNSYVLEEDGPFPHPTEDHVTFLRVEDVVVASSMQIRDGMNYVQGTFSLHLDRQLETDIRDRLAFPFLSNLEYFDSLKLI